MTSVTATSNFLGVQVEEELDRPVPTFPVKQQVERREYDSVTMSLPQEELEQWVVSTGVELGPTIPQDRKIKVLRLLHHFCHLDCSNLEDLPKTDLL